MCLFLKLKETVGKKNEKEILLQEKSLLLEEKVKNISELDIKIGRHYVKFPPYNVFHEILYCDIYVFYTDAWLQEHFHLFYRGSETEG